MNKSQQNAINFLRSRLEQSISPDSAERYGARVSVFEVKPTDYGTFWVRAEINYDGLEPGNLLRFLCHEHWYVAVGKRGALIAHMYPDSLKQFKGRKFGGINIK